MLDRHVPNEDDYKSIVLNAYRRTNADWRSSVIANEYPLGASSVRVDLAILGREFIGVEIKSERDSLKRLQNQVANYSHYFDRVVVAVSDRHLRNLDWAMVRVAEVWTIDRSGRLKAASSPSEFGEIKCLSDLMPHKVAASSA
ncbi:sce7726 family protein [Phenylobacterium sp.]|uniref:sce7726 family protein n=1 Tax=Phenylobacterium sp. TaxID=1871053 RepID=UPI00374CE360